MVSRISEKIIRWCKTQYCIDDAECHIAEYGIKVMLNTSSKVISIFLIGSILGYSKEVMITLTTFCSMRWFAGGYHCKTDLGCFFTMLFVCLFPISLLEIDFNIIGWIWPVIMIYSSYEIIRYAPRNSRVNPIIDSHILLKKKMRTYILLGGIIFC